MNLLLVLDEEVVLVQWVEKLKNFQAHFEVLHRLHPNPWTCAFLTFGKSLGCFISAMVFLFVFVNRVSVDSLYGDLERSLTRLCGSTVAESSSVSWVVRGWIC